MNEEIERLLKQISLLEKAGNELAERAWFTVRNYDGLHRLGSAVAEWIETVSSLNKKETEKKCVMSPKYGKDKNKNLHFDLN